MALDYRIRFYLDITHYERLIAFTGAARLHLNGYMGLHEDCKRLLNESLMPFNADQPAKHDRGEEEITALFFASLVRTICTVKPVGRRLKPDAERTLCRHCVILALYEQLYRAGLQISSPLFQVERGSLSDILSIPADHWIDDLCTLSWLFYDNFENLIKADGVNLNPVFCGSGHVGGADADMILDNCLIDIKATVRPGLDKLWLYQLLGYVLLDYRDVHKIRSIAVLYARQGFMLRWELDEIMCVMCGNYKPPSLADLRKEFQEMIVRERETRAQFNVVKA
jgi:hypothetical protein